MSSSPGDIPPSRLRVMQIVAGALIFGVLALLAVVLFIVHVRNGGRGTAPPRDEPIVSLVAVVLLAVQAPLAFILPGLVTRASLRRIASGTWQPGLGVNAELFPPDTSKLLAVRQTALIIALALLEGAAFLGAIGYLLEASPLALAVAAVALVLMLARFPTENGTRQWLERQTDELAELRQQGNLPGGM